MEMPFKLSLCSGSNGVHALSINDLGYQAGIPYNYHVALVASGTCLMLIINKMASTIHSVVRIKRYAKKNRIYEVLLFR